MARVTLWLVLFGLDLIWCEDGLTQQEPLMTTIFACQGDRVPIMAAKQYAEGDIEHSKIYKNGVGIENRMVKEGNKPPVLTPADKVEYINPLGIHLRDVTVADGGPYEIHAVFRDGATAWLRFNVTVFTGCPDKREFYDPRIMYKVDIGILAPLPDTRIIQLDDTYHHLTLNVSIPKSNLPATCIIKGRGRTITAEGAGDTAVYCLATFHNQLQGPDNYTVMVDLEHLLLQSPSKTHIEVFVADTMDTSEAPSGGLPGYAIALIIVGVIIIIVVVVFAILRLRYWDNVKSVFNKKSKEKPPPPEEGKEMLSKTPSGEKKPNDSADGPTQPDDAPPTPEGAARPVSGVQESQPGGMQGQPAPPHGTIPEFPR